MMLVTLEEAKDHLNVDFPDADADIRLKVKSASGAVLNYLKSRRMLYKFQYNEQGDLVLDSQGNGTYELDSQGDRIIRDEVKHAVLLLTGIFFRDRDGVEMALWQPGFLPAPVTALLYPLRDPAIA